jgi:hypothetical protein
MKALSEITLPDLRAFLSRLATLAAPAAPRRDRERAAPRRDRERRVDR